MTHADPSTAFESSLRDGDELAVGDTGWLDGSGRAADVQVQGRSGVVTLTDRSVATVVACGTVVSTTRWIEVRAEKPGTATLRLSRKVLRITVTAG
ncbi:hypothetical protein [Nakamurella endophytica]|uniref:hypothetical protein n=1 Tax=Nakamurella endophytica TaxID=1748367 RepID=UPI001E5C8941|nr:hypothetical protein [Nakamurella endophytica]